jgi:hypothetical protein
VQVLWMGSICISVGIALALKIHLRSLDYPFVPAKVLKWISW